MPAALTRRAEWAVAVQLRTTWPQVLAWRMRRQLLDPEVIAFVRASESPNGKPLLLVANEISGTLNVLEVNSPL